MKNKRVCISVIISLMALVFSYTPVIAQNELSLKDIKLPHGFSISVYVNVPNARSMVLSDNGVLFVGNRSEDKVYAVVDTNGDNIGNKVYIIVVTHW